MAVKLRHHKFTADQYLKMGELGVLPKRGVELIEGEILDMAPIGDRHNASVDRLVRWFVQRIGDHAIVRAQGSIRLNIRTQPQPDLALLAWRDDFYADGGVSPADVL